MQIPSKTVRPTESLRVGILLASYQGARFIGEQIDSIMAQTHENWVMVVCDDGSSDSTMRVVESYAADPRIVVLPKSGDDQGVTENFSRLLSWAIDNLNPELYLFSDQDDVWCSDKLEKIVGTYQSLAPRSGGNEPVLLHSDLRVVDSTLAPIATSFYQYQGITTGNSVRLNELLVQNSVTGCAMAFNSVLARLACPIPKDAIWHDWWVGLLAACVGRICFIPDALVLYRQSGSNTLGAKRYRALDEFRLVVGRKHMRDRVVHLRLCRRQAQAVFRRVQESCLPFSRGAAATIKSFIELLERPRRARVRLLLRFRFGRRGWLGKAKFAVGALLLSKQKN